MNNMRRMIGITTVLILLLKLCNSLPVTSKALDSDSDLLIWQTAWYAQYLNGRARETPYTGEAKKITAKSIFITPNLQHNVSHCPPGYKIDDNGKCIKVVSIDQEELLVTRLQSLYAPQQTTGDSKGSDYDYSFEEDSNEPTHFDLSLIPFESDNDTNSDPQTSSTVQYDADDSFRESDDADDKIASTIASATTVSNDSNELIKDFQQELDETTVYSDDVEQNVSASQDDPENVTAGLSETNQNSTSLYSTIEAENFTFLEEIDTTTPPETSLDSLHDDISHLEDQFNESDNYTTTSSELVINKSESFYEQSQAEEAISGGNESDSGSIHLHEYLDASSFNDSFTLESTTDIDYDETTTTNNLQTLAEVEQTEHEEQHDHAESKMFADEKIGSTTVQIISTTNQPYESRIIKDDKQDLELENVEVSNKFVYHHLSATEHHLSADENRALTTPPSTAFVRFPNNDDEDDRRKQRVKFPEERFSWPRDNGYMQFWHNQPLINDFKFFSRGNSRGPIGSFTTRS